MRAVRQFGLLFLFLFSTIAAKAQLIVNVRPQKPAVITRTPPPGPAYVWVEEDWQVAKDQYEWAGGRWEPQPLRNATWVPGHWEQRDNGHVWVAGYWKSSLLRGHYIQNHRQIGERREGVIVETTSPAPVR